MLMGAPFFPPLAQNIDSLKRKPVGREDQADVIIVGGGLGGCAAARRIVACA